MPCRTADRGSYGGTDDTSRLGERNRMKSTAWKAVVATLGSLALLAVSAGSASAVLTDPELVSLNSSEEQPQVGVGSQTLASQDGRFVAFGAAGANMDGVMAPGQPWGLPIYMRDRLQGTT